MDHSEAPRQSQVQEPRFGGLPLGPAIKNNESGLNDSISVNEGGHCQSAAVTGTTALHALMQCYSDSEDETPPKMLRSDNVPVAAFGAGANSAPSSVNGSERNSRLPKQEAIEADVKKTLNSLVDRVHAKISNDQRKQSLRQKQLQTRSVNPRKLSLLEKLLAKDIRHERNILLQCADYVIKMNFFDGEDFEV